MYFINSTATISLFLRIKVAENQETMNIEEFGNLCLFKGHTIKKVGGYYFCSQHYTGFPFPVYNAFPLNQIISVDPGFTRVLKWKFMITQVLLDLPNIDIYEYVLTTNSYGFEQFGKNTRRGIKKSLKVFSFREPSLEDLLNKGFDINKQTCERQSWTDETMIDYNKWSDFVNSIFNFSGFTILGAYLENRMVGYLVVYELEGKFNIAGAFIDRNHTSGASPMKGLLFTMINDLIRKNGMITLSYGFHKFSKPTSLTSFKEMMNFQRYSYAIGYIVNPFLLLGLRFGVFILIKLLKRSSLKRKWAKDTIRLFQGHRRLKKALSQARGVPERKTEPYQVSEAA